MKCPLKADTTHIIIVTQALRSGPYFQLPLDISTQTLFQDDRKKGEMVN